MSWGCNFPMWTFLLNNFLFWGERERDRQKDRERDREGGREREKEREGETDRQANRQTETDREMFRDFLSILRFGIWGLETWIFRDFLSFIEHLATFLPFITKEVSLREKDKVWSVKICWSQSVSCQHLCWQCSMLIWILKPVLTWILFVLKKVRFKCYLCKKPVTSENVPSEAHVKN